MEDPTFIIQIWETLPKWLQVTLAVVLAVGWVITKLRGMGTKKELQDKDSGMKTMIGQINKYSKFLEMAKPLLAKTPVENDGDKRMVALVTAGVKKLVAEATEPDPEVKKAVDDAIAEVESAVVESQAPNAKKGLKSKTFSMAAKALDKMF